MRRRRRLNFLLINTVGSFFLFYILVWNVPRTSLVPHCTTTSQRQSRVWPAFTRSDRRADSPRHSSTDSMRIRESLGNMIVFLPVVIFFISAVPFSCSNRRCDGLQCGWICWSWRSPASSPCWWSSSQAVSVRLMREWLSLLLFRYNSYNSIFCSISRIINHLILLVFHKKKMLKRIKENWQMYSSFNNLAIM